MNCQSILLFALAACDVLLLILSLLVLCCGNQRYAKLKKENARLCRLLDEQFLMQDDYMNACTAMMREASRTKA